MFFPWSIAEQLLVLVQLVAAMLLGALIGLDREVANKPAGLRTHMLVAGAATILVAFGKMTVSQLTGELDRQVISADPIRIIEAIITGVSFLGAGTIIRQSAKGSVQGLTTAASLLFASVIGIGVALSLWIIALGATGLVLVILRLLPMLERFLERKSD